MTRLLAAVLVAAASSAFASDDPLVGPRWRLIAMGEAPVEVEGQREPPHLVFEADGAVYGSGGCNRLRGSYETGPDGAISFGPIASTMMMCPEEAMRRERGFTGMLGVVERVEVEDARMRLFANGAPLAVFEAE